MSADCRPDPGRIDSMMYYLKPYLVYQTRQRQKFLQILIPGTDYPLPRSDVRYTYTQILMPPLLFGHPLTAVPGSALLFQACCLICVKDEPVPGFKLDEFYDNPNQFQSGMMEAPCKSCPCQFELDSPSPMSGMRNVNNGCS